MSSKKQDESPEASPLKGPAPKAIPEDTSDVAFEDGVPLNPMAADQSVQFISGTPANGDAKVEIGDSGTTAPTFVGLGKEELMKYANDPFWVKLRWFLFILFWVLWIAMLAGAIVIIVLAPRCAEKKTTAETYYQIKASELIKDEKIDENTQALNNLGVKSIILVEALEHQPDGPEAVTNFEKFDNELKEGLLVKAIEKLRDHGMKILLQIVPNHSGTSHEWFNDSISAEKYVRKPETDVGKSVWMMRDADRTAWTVDNRPGFENTSYLQQFKGNLADLNFRNEGIIDAFKQIFSNWRSRSIDGFSVPKASYLVENLDSLMNSSGLVNQPENLDVLRRIVGISSQGPILVELDNPSDDILEAYIAKDMTPVLKPGDTSNPSSIKDILDTLINYPQAVVNLAHQSPEKARVLNLLASAAGSHSILNHEVSTTDESDFLKKLLEFQKNNPKGKSARLTTATQANIVAILRSDDEHDHLILANMGQIPNTFSPSAFNLTESSKGAVVLSTANAEQKIMHQTEGNITLSGLSGLIIKLDKEEVSS